MNTAVMAGERQRLAVLTACYNEAEVIGTFYEAVKKTFAEMEGLEFRLVFVDDGSTDGTLAKLNELAAKDPMVQVYSLSRNFGHQIALTAGLDRVECDAVVMMDSDLQHPPVLLPEMVRLWRDGNDVVSAVRSQTDDSGWLKRTTSGGFYWLIQRMSDTPIVTGAADFCLLSRKAQQALKQMPERHRFLRGMVSWIGFKRALVPFEAPARAAGTSKYTLGKMLRLAFNATFSFSAVPLRLAAQVGMFTIFLSLLYLLFIVVSLITHKNVVPGWTSIIFVTTFLGGVQLAFIGILGEYIARIFEEVKGRPLYLFKQEPPPESKNLNSPDGRHS